MRAAARGDATCRCEIGGTPILHGADLTLDAGRLVAIVGPNGAGKSTLVRAVAGLQRIAGGSVRWARRGRALAARPPPGAPARVRAAARARPRRRHRARGGRASAARRTSGRCSGRRAPTARRSTRDGARRRRARFADRLLTTLSGGELQRVQIAVGARPGGAGADRRRADLAPRPRRDRGVARLLRRLADDGLAVAARRPRPRARRGGRRHGRGDVGAAARSPPARPARCSTRARLARCGTSTPRSRPTPTATPPCASRGSAEQEEP